MNAYELADWLDNIPVNDFESLDQHHYTRKASNMLRQQADRIAELEKDLHMLQRHYDQLDHDLPNAEPVAWVLESDNSPTEFCWNEKELDEVTDFYDMEGWNYKVYPVYTTSQTKPLSDEEIEQIYYKDFNYEDADMVKFARAIEERILGK